MADNEAITLLRSIDASLKQLLRQTAAQVEPQVADDRDLDGKYGDPEVRFLPRDWTGDDFRRYRFSECPPALLDMLADAYDYFARKAEETNEQYNGKATAPYKRKDAARARGWAKRLRAGYQPPAPAAPRQPEAEQAPSFTDEYAKRAREIQSEWPDEAMADDIPF